MRRLLLGLVLAAAVSAGAVPAYASDVTVRTTVSPRTVGLGEPFLYTVEVHGPSGMTVFADGAPFVAAAPPKRSRSDGGKVVRIEQRLLCLDRACAPDKKARAVALARVRVIGAGAPVRAPAAMVTLVPRVPEEAVRAARARYRIDDHVRAARAPWGAAVALLAALAIALLAVAVMLVVRGVRRAPASSTGRTAAPGGLAYALRLLRESARRTAPDRRRAADYVARTVDDQGRTSAADEARRLAWSAPEPQPPQVVALADRVEATNGSDA